MAVDDQVGICRGYVFLEYRFKLRYPWKGLKKTMGILPLFIALIGVWVGSGLAVNSVEKLAGRMHRSSFAVSFFVLGFVTSLTEISVALNAFMDNTVEISVGNLLGGSLVLFLFIIPLVGILDNGIALNNSFGRLGLLFCIVFLLLPFWLILDNVISVDDSVFLLTLYILLAIYLYWNDRVHGEPVKRNRAIGKGIWGHPVFLVSLIVVGAIILILSSSFLVDEIIQIAQELKISAFVISLIGLSIGTNFPEISLAIRAALKRKTDIALGNYIGSAMFNMVILAFLGVFSNGILIRENFIKLLSFSLVGFILFYWFIRSKNELSKKESIILLCIYLLFIFNEIFSQ